MKKDLTIYEMEVAENKRLRKRVETLERALGLARAFISGQQIEHALLDQKKPRLTLGKHIDKILSDKKWKTP